MLRSRPATEGENSLHYFYLSTGEIPETIKMWSDEWEGLLPLIKNPEIHSRP